MKGSQGPRCSQLLLEVQSHRAAIGALRGAKSFSRISSRNYTRQTQEKPGFASGCHIAASPPSPALSKSLLRVRYLAVGSLPSRLPEPADREKNFFSLLLASLPASRPRLRDNEETPTSHTVG